MRERAGKRLEPLAFRRLRNVAVTAADGQHDELARRTLERARDLIGGRQIIVPGHDEVGIDAVDGFDEATRERLSADFESAKDALTKFSGVATGFDGAVHQHETAADEYRHDEED